MPLIWTDKLAIQNAFAGRVHSVRFVLIYPQTIAQAHRYFERGFDDRSEKLRPYDHAMDVQIARGQN